MEPIVNKVSQSGLMEINLGDLYQKGDRVVFDIKEHLFQGLILREKEFREFVKNENWEQYKNKFVAIICSSDAIVPTWAYMLLTVVLEPFAKKIFFGTMENLEINLFQESLSKLDVQSFADQRVVIKGCSKISVPVSAYVELTRLLRPLAKSIMYGEPCSTVPLYKKKS
ncbi:MAG: DUF2480 family protein [Bacteroidia bacterium]